MAVSEAGEGDGLIAAFAQVTREKWVGFAVPVPFWIVKMAAWPPVAERSMIDGKAPGYEAGSRWDAGRGGAICSIETYALGCDVVDVGCSASLVAVAAHMIRS